MRSVEQYRDQLISLLPPGRAMRAERLSTLWEVLFGFAGELSRVDGRMDDLITESLISTTSELLTDFENEFALPEPGTSLAPTIQGRIDVLLAKQIKVGQQDNGYFIDIAKELGYTITIEESRPAWAGVMVAGDTCGGLEVLFKWIVWIEKTDDINWNISQLVHDLTDAKPGHTEIFFRFLGAEFSRGFSTGFNSIQHYDGSWNDFAFDAGFSNGFANNTDYDGVNYIGSFSKAFNIDYDLNAGGGFYNDDFSTAFNTPA